MAHCKNCGRNSGKYPMCKNCYRSHSMRSTATKYASTYGRKAGSYGLRYSKRGAVFAKNRSAKLIADARQRNAEKNRRNANVVRSIMNSNLPPEKKQQEIAKFRAQKTGFFSRFRKY